MKVAAIVPAAGIGRRIRSRIDKPYIKLHNRPILAHTLLKLSKNKLIDQIVVALSKKRIEKARREIIDRYGLRKVTLVSGGKERKDSVLNALKTISCDVDYILIHDGIRPFVTDGLIKSSLDAARRYGASVAAVPVKPTLKRVGRDRRIVNTPDRRDLWEAQTPQVFKRDLIVNAYKEAGGRKSKITDDSMLVEFLGIKPKIVLGSYDNIKITTPEDLKLAKILFRKR